MLGGGGSGLAGVEVVLFALFGGFIEALGVDIDHGDDVVIEGDHAGVGEAFAVGTDLDEVEAFGGGVLPAEEEIGAGEGAGGETGGGGEEVTAGEGTGGHEGRGVVKMRMAKTWDEEGMLQEAMRRPGQ